MSFLRTSLWLFACLFIVIDSSHAKPQGREEEYDGEYEEGEEEYESGEEGDYDGEYEGDEEDYESYDEDEEGDYGHEEEDYEEENYEHEEYDEDYRGMGEGDTEEEDGEEDMYEESGDFDSPVDEDEVPLKSVVPEMISTPMSIEVHVGDRLELPCTAKVRRVSLYCNILQ